MSSGKLTLMTDDRSGNDFIRRTDGSLTVQALLILIATRIVLFGLSAFSLRIMPRLPFYSAQPSDLRYSTDLLLDGWARWDSGHYVRIALHGYGVDEKGSPAFFPLFPLLMRGLVAISGLTPTTDHLGMVAILIANVCFAIAVPLFAHLVNHTFGMEIARTATLLLCISPFSFFFIAGYSESLFLLLTTLAFTLASRRRWLVAALCAAFAASSRLTGLALLPALLLLGWRLHARPRDLLGIALLSPLGTVAWSAWCWWRLGDPRAWLTAQDNWGGWYERVGYYLDLFTRHPRETLIGDPRHLIILLNVALLGMWLVSLPWVWRLLDPGIALFTTLLVVTHGATTWISMGRYLLPAIGFYVTFAILLTRAGWNGWPRDLAIASSCILLAMLTLLFGHGFWVI